MGFVGTTSFGCRPAGSPVHSHRTASINHFPAYERNMKLATAFMPAPCPAFVASGFGVAMGDPQLFPIVDDVEVRFHRGDETALADVYDQHSSLIYSYCRRQLGAEAARDLTQEVFVAAWRARHRFDPEKGSIRAWLMGITKNKIIDLFRKRGRRPQIADGAEVEHSSDEVDSIQVERIADRMILATALDELPDRARSVIELSFYEQLTHPEIAERTGLPLGTVKSDIRRSLIKLRRHLENVND